MWVNHIPNENYFCAEKIKNIPNFLKHQIDQLNNLHMPGYSYRLPLLNINWPSLLGLEEGGGDGSPIQFMNSIAYLYFPLFDC